VHDFDLSDLQISQRTVPLAMTSLTTAVLPRGITSAVLDVAYAGEENREFFNESLRRDGTRKRARALERARKEAQREGKELDPAHFLRYKQDEREEDRDLIARYIVRGWRGVRNRQDQEVSHSAEAALALMRALPDWLFDRLRRFVTTEENFVVAALDPEEVAEQAGN